MVLFHFVYNFYTYSGATQQAIKISKGLRDNGYNVIFINFSNKVNTFNKGLSDGFVVLNIPCSPIKKIIYFLYLIYKYKPSICHFHGFHRLPVIVFSLMFNIPSLLKCTLLGKDDLNSLFSGRFGFLYKLICLRIKYFNSLNSVIYDINKQYVKENRLVVIPNGVDIEKLENTNVNRRENYLFCGAVVPRKSVLQVIKYFNNEGLDGELFIAGPNSRDIAEFDGQYYLECLDEANKSGRVSFLGTINKDELKELYCTVKAVIFFSEREGTPNVVLESLSFNCPVIHNGKDPVIKEILNNEFDELHYLSYLKSEDFVIDKINNGVYQKLVLPFSIEHVSNLHRELYEKIS